MEIKDIPSEAFQNRAVGEHKVTKQNKIIKFLET